MRVAVIFFGVARALAMTNESIKNCIYACNPNEEFSFYTIASLNIIESITNPRTGENGISLNPADALLLNADANALVRQTDLAIAESLSAAGQQRNFFANEWISVRNSLHQLASLRRAWRHSRRGFQQIRCGHSNECKAVLYSERTSLFFDE